jgi:hypothetical protein
MRPLRFCRLRSGRAGQRRVSTECVSPPPCAENGIASFDRIRQRRRRGGHNRNGLAHAAVEATEAAAAEAANAAPARIAGEPVREAAMAAFARSSKRFLAAN